MSEYAALVREHVGTEIADALRFFAEVIQGPVTDPIPDLTADAWRSMRCRDGARVPESEVDMLTDHAACRCSFCRWQARNGPIVREWRVSQEHRPHQRHRYPFGSVSAALASLQRPDGAPLRSQLGSFVSRAREVRALGTAIQTTIRHDRDPTEVRRSDDSVDVERAVVLACSSPDVRASVSTGAAVLFVALSVSERFTPDPLASAFGLSEGAVRGIVSRARKRVTVELSARDLIPPPRERARLDAEIAKRRAELVG